MLDSIAFNKYFFYILIVNWYTVSAIVRINCMCISLYLYVCNMISLCMYRLKEQNLSSWQTLIKIKGNISNINKTVVQIKTKVYYLRYF